MFDVIIFHHHLPPQKNRAVYEIMWKNMSEADSPSMTKIRRKKNPKIQTDRHTHTHSYIILNAFPWAGVTTRYELDDPGIESRWGKDYHHPSKQALGPTQPPVQRVRGLFPRDKVARTWR
jgi:hypothetical protein